MFVRPAACAAAIASVKRVSASANIPIWSTSGPMSNAAWHIDIPSVGVAEAGVEIRLRRAR